VNLYQDATVTLDGVRFDISGNYPVGTTVTVRVSQPVKLAFRKPAWCPKMDVSQDGNAYTLAFDMNPRLVNRTIPDDPENAPSDKSWVFKRYRDHWSTQVNRDVQKSYRTKPAALVMWGPLVLAKAQRVGATRAQIRDDSTVNNQGYSVTLAPLPATDTWGLWDVTLSKPGAETVKARACDFQSAGDDPFGEGADAFSIWF
jgi:hypothetical protein